MRPRATWRITWKGPGCTDVSRSSGVASRAAERGGEHHDLRWPPRSSSSLGCGRARQAISRIEELDNAPQHLLADALEKHGLTWIQD